MTAVRGEFPQYVAPADGSALFPLSVDMVYLGPVKKRVLMLTLPLPDSPVGRRSVRFVLKDVATPEVPFIESMDADQMEVEMSRLNIRAICKRVAL